MLGYSVTEDDSARTEISSHHLTPKVVVSQTVPDLDEKLQMGNKVTSFLPTDKLLEVMMNTPALEQVPLGVKENVYFNVSNKDNIARAVSGKRQHWLDDCGAYIKTNGTKSHYVVKDRNTFTDTKFVKGKYMRQVQEKGKTLFVPLQPQPDPEDVLIISRLYSKLKRDAGYRRRISVVLHLPRCMHDMSCVLDVALYEYVGKFPGLTSHGNCKMSKGFYQRTAVQHGTPTRKKPPRAKKTY